MRGWNKKDTLKKLTLPLLFLFIILFFIFTSNSIITVKLQELRFQISKQQLLNYELSSNLLKQKFRQMLLNRDDYTKEIKLNITESAILNSRMQETRAQESDSGLIMDIKEKFGIIVINGVRFLSLKNMLRLSNDLQELVKLQFAFYLERTRKFSSASKKYLELEKKFKKDSSDYAFVLLHQGFCLAMRGETEKALVKLYKTEELFPGTHFGENARILITLLLEGKRQRSRINKEFQDDKRRAVALYQAGQYKQALAILNSMPERTQKENLMRARSLEEMGNTSKAVQAYIDLVQKSEDPEMAKQANRRLLMIGSIYEKNKELTDYSKKNAQEMGDLDIVKKVEVGTKLIQKAVILKKIEEVTSDATTEEDKELFGLQKELVAIRNTTQKQLKRNIKDKLEGVQPLGERTSDTVQIEKNSTEENLIKENPIEEIPPKQQESLPEESTVGKKDEKNVVTGKLRIELVDGRVLFGQNIWFNGKKVFLKTPMHNSVLPGKMIKSISRQSSGFFSKTKLKLETNDGKVIWVKKATKKGTDFILESNAGEIKIPLEKIKKLTL
ncbi:MAG: hypothetical protein AAF518_09945 [Spirochaetota bacterium]